MTYEEFINNILETRGRFGCGDEYHERHHILPRCMGGTNDEENLIDLFAREHFEAHRLLALENPENDGLVYAWWNMAHCLKNKNGDTVRECISAEEYEEAKKIYSNKLKEIFINPENTPFYGRRHTEEAKKKMSDHAKGENNPMYGKFGDSNPMFGRHHSDESKKKMKDNRPSYYGKNNPRYGKHCTEETKKKISTRVKEKFRNPKNHPMFGKHHSNETKFMISLASKARLANPENHPMYGKHHTEESKLKMSESKKGLKLGKDNPRSVNVCQYDRNYGLIAIYECINQASSNLNINYSNISSCCAGKIKTTGGFVWKYLYNQTRKDGTIIPGAITLGLITEEEALKMLEEQKDTEGEKENYGLQREDCENN